MSVVRSSMLSHYVTNLCPRDFDPLELGQQAVMTALEPSYA